LNETDVIKNIIDKIKTRRTKWKLSQRAINRDTLAELGLMEEIAFNQIYDSISWRDYSQGPMADDHHLPGDVWVFGLIISGQECYLKFQDKPNETVMWISLHIALHPMRYPYRDY